MRPESLFLREMIDAAETIVELVGPRSIAELGDDRIRRAAVLWHFTVLGEAANHLAASGPIVATSPVTSHPSSVQACLVAPDRPR